MAELPIPRGVGTCGMVLYFGAMLGIAVVETGVRKTRDGVDNLKRKAKKAIRRPITSRRHKLSAQDATECLQEYIEQRRLDPAKLTRLLAQGARITGPTRWAHNEQTTCPLRSALWLACPNFLDEAGREAKAIAAADASLRLLLDTEQAQDQHNMGWRSVEGTTLLAVALSGGRVDWAHRLVRLGAPVEHAQAQQMTLLQVAANEVNLGGIRFLMQYGADPYARGSVNWSAVQRLQDIVDGKMQGDRLDGRAVPMEEYQAALGLMLMYIDLDLPSRCRNILAGGEAWASNTPGAAALQSLVVDEYEQLLDVQKQEHYAYQVVQNAVPQMPGSCVAWIIQYADALPRNLLAFVYQRHVQPRLQAAAAAAGGGLGSLKSLGSLGPGPVVGADGLTKSARRRRRRDRLKATMKSANGWLAG